jgi:signal transduction histidine kinase
VTRERLQRLFLLWGRPIAPLAALAVYAIADAASPSSRADHMVALLVLAEVLALGYRLASIRLPPANVLRVALALDTLLIAALAVASDRPGAIAIAYFWPIALGAWLLGPAETIGYTLLASACALVAPMLAGRPQDTFVTFTIVIVLIMIGTLVALLSRTALQTENELQHERRIEISVASILERTRTTTAPRDLLTSIVEVLGEECHASRAILRRADGEVYLWERAGANHLDATLVSPVMQQILRTGESVVVRDIAETTDAMAAYMRDSDIARMIGYPLIWQGEVIGAVGLHDDTQGEWTGAVDTVVRRVAPQFAAALVQAEAFERLQQVSHMREELIANVSHELRTPLTSTIGFLQTLERHDLELSDEERRHLTMIARREAERLALLVQDLLQLATIERGALRLDQAQVELRPLAEEAVAAVNSPDGRQISLEVPDALVVHADPARLLQILRNLVENGMRHGAGTITIAAESNAGRVRLVVSDEGRGVQPEHVGDLFVPFAHWSGRNDSSGLGLAIARRIAEAHGGTLDYRAAVGEHTRHAFVLEIPA